MYHKNAKTILLSTNINIFLNDTHCILKLDNFLQLSKRRVLWQKNSFGQKLKQVRKAKHLTQEALAELAGINEKHISKIETGVYFPTYNTLNKILTALDLNIEDVGLELNSLKTNDNPFYIKALQILNDAKSEQELEYYYGILRQAQKGIDILKIN